MDVWISLTSSPKVALLRLIDLLLHCQQNTAQIVGKIYLPLHHLCGSFNKCSSNFCLQLWFIHFFLQRKFCFCTQITSVHALEYFHFWETSWSSCPALPQTPNVKALPFHLCQCSQQLLDLSHQPCEVAHVGGRSRSEMPQAVWGREALAVPQKLQQRVFSMAAKDKNAINKHFLTRTDFHLDFHFLSAFFNGCNFKV